MAKIKDINENKRVVSSNTKNLKILTLKTRSDYKMEGIKLTSLTDVAVVFPFARESEIIIEGIKTIFGKNYDKSIYKYWIPKIVKYKDTNFKKKRIIIDNSKKRDSYDIMIENQLNKIKDKHCSFYKRESKNTIMDFSSIVKPILPPWSQKDMWGKSIVVNKIEAIIIEWLLVLLDGPSKISGESFNSLTLIPGSQFANSNHTKILMGIRVPNLNISKTKYINPGLTSIPKEMKTTSLNEFIPMIILRVIISALTNELLDPKLDHLVALLQDKSIAFVFYNKKGKAFVIDMNDPDVHKLSKDSVGLVKQITERFKILVQYNDPDMLVEEDDDIIEVDNIKETPKNDSDKALDLLDNRMNSQTKSNKTIIFADKTTDKTSSTPIVKKFSTKALGMIDSEGELVLNEDDDIEIGMSDSELEESDSKDIENKPIGTTQDLIGILDKDLKPKQSPADIRRINTIKEKYKSVTVEDRTIDEIIKDVESLTIRTNEAPVDVKDKSTKSSTMLDMEKSYIENTMERDMIKIIDGLSKNTNYPIYITDIKKTDVSDTMTDKYEYNIKLTDEKGKIHSITFLVPKIDSSGFMKINGNRNILKKQLTLLPIVKFKPDTVMVSSNFNKLIVERHGTILNKNTIALTKLIEKQLVNNSAIKVYYGNNTSSNKSVMTTIEYDILAKKYHRIRLGIGDNKFEFIFNQKEIRLKIIEGKFKYNFKSNKLPFGLDYNTKSVLDIDVVNDDQSICTMIFDEIVEREIYYDMENFLSSINIPKRRMYTKILVNSTGKGVPMIIFLGSLFGLSTVLKSEGVKYEFAKERIKGDDRSYIKFQDGFLYYPDYPISGVLLINGLSTMDTDIYNFKDFDTVAPYLDYLYTIYRARNVFKGYNTIKEFFLDEITVEILKDMKQPTDFLEVFLYVNNLLADNKFKRETDMSIYRVRGMEVINSLIYSAIASNYQKIIYNKPGARQTKKLSIKKDEVFIRLNKIQIMEPYDCTNPINELKAKAGVTYKGFQGIKSSNAFTLEKRSYDKTAIGVIALASPDSEQVGISRELSMNPNITSTRGYIDPVQSKDDISKLSFTQLAAPEEAAVAFVNMHDSSKRVGLTSSMSKHIINTKNANPSIVSTGMDSSTPYLVGDIYVPKSKSDGVIKKIDNDNKIIIIQYKNGKTETINYGQKIERNSDVHLLLDMESNVKVGQKVKKDTIIAYDKNFFKKASDGEIRTTMGTISRVGIIESDITDDDSSAITSTFAKKLGTDIIKRKQISVSDHINIINSKSIGDHVIHGDPLMTFENADDNVTNELLTALGDVDERTLDLVRNSPKAPITGEIIDIKIYYSKPVDTMSTTCSKFVGDWIKKIKARIKSEKEFGINSDMEMYIGITKPIRDRINGAILPPSEPGAGVILIEYYISHEDSLSVGDKILFYSSLKSVIAYNYPDDKIPRTENGHLIDAVTSSIGISSRMVESIYLGGTIGTILTDGSIEIADEYLK